MKNSPKKPCIEKEWFRALLLVLAFSLGGIIVKFFSDKILCSFISDVDAHKYFLVPLFSLVIVFVLWWFRTYDTRQQISKSQAQIEHGNFVIGLNKLTEQDSFSIAIGVQILTQISQNTNEFDKNIRLAFIKRLQKLPSEMLTYNPMDPSQSKFFGSGKTTVSIFDISLNYLPHIFEWIVKEEKNLGNEYIDVPEMNFAIEELDETKDFAATVRMEPKKISVREIEIALDERRAAKA